MKLTFLGTSHGVPAADRFCSCAMLEVNGAHYLIDCGAPAAELLIRRGIPYTALRAIFTNHAHGDHTNGLLHLCDLSNWKFKDASYDVFLTEQALADALRANVIAGAAIDVLSTEPMAQDCPLFGIKNCTITPHVAWAPIETRVRLMDIVCNNIRGFLSGAPVNVVN